MKLGQEKSVSPEEKLLRMIQGGDGPAPEGTVTKPPKLAVKLAPAARPPAAPRDTPPAPAIAVAPPVVAKASAPAVVVPKPAAKPAAAPSPKPSPAEKGRATLKLAGTAAAPPPATAPVGSPPPAAPPAGSSPAVRPSPKAIAKPFAIATLNKIVGVLVLFLLVWGIIDVVMTVMAAPSDGEFGGGLAGRVPIAESEEALPELGAILSAWDERSLFGPGKVVDPVLPPTGNEAVKELVLKGVSEAPDGGIDAIFVNNRTAKMYFLRVGESFTLEEKEYKLTSIEKNRARFSDGVRDVYVP